MSRLFAAVFILCCLLAAPGKADFRGPTYVLPDGTLKVDGRRVRLYGVYIPRTDRFCRTTLRPVRCAPRAALQLDTRIQGFVRCQPRLRYADRSVAAVCWTRGDGSVLAPELDLGAWLISQGWAVAAPGAPFEYVVQERIARTNGRGIWGFQADSIN